MTPGPSNKRPRLSPDNTYNDHPNLYPAPSSSSATSAPAINSNASSSFRNVSACNRCRVRKNRCDQNLPACTSCEKAGVKCVGFDPITKRPIPRTYVYYLESRVTYLEELLSSNHVPYAAPSSDFDLGSKPSVDQGPGLSPPSELPSNTTWRHARARSSNTIMTEAGS